MTNEAINEAVARKLGWKPIEIQKFTEIDGGRRLKINNTWANDFSQLPCLPNYCEDVEAAWEIVSKKFSSFFLSYDECTETWFVKWDNQRRCEKDCRYKAEADAAPMAICLAFLKLNEV